MLSPDVGLTMLIFDGKDEAIELMRKKQTTGENNGG